MNRIRELREARGLSGERLADLCNTTRQTINRLERGERRLTTDWMERIARALNVDPAALLRRPSGLVESAPVFRPAQPTCQDAADEFRLFGAFQARIEQLYIDEGFRISTEHLGRLALEIYATIDRGGTPEATRRQLDTALRELRAHLREQRSELLRMK